MFKDVTEQDFYYFIKNYPEVIEMDLFMDQVTYNDFKLGKWPASVIARYNLNPFNGEKTKFEIKIYLMENLNIIKE